MKFAYKFRAYPSKAQKAILHHQMCLSKELYNFLLVKSKEHFKDTGKTFSEYDMNKWITKFKKEYPQYQEIHSQVLQNISFRLHGAYKNFFRRVKEKRNGKHQNVGFPRFRKFTSSLTYPDSGFKIDRKNVHLSTIGNVNFVNHREIEGEINTLTIKKTKSQEWFITFSVKKGDRPFVPNGKAQVGLDLGLKEYATLSDNVKIPNMRFGKEYEKRLIKSHRKVSRRAKGSRNRRKAAVLLSKVYDKITKRREDFAHKFSHNLVNSYSFIAYEDLQIRNMAKNHKLAKSINDASWARFTQFLCYKAESAGCRVVDVLPQYTSQTCHICGSVQEMSLEMRIFDCGKCGLQIDRDLNASKNILRLGLEKSPTTEGHSGSHASGDIVRPPHMEADVAESGTTSGAVHD